MLKEGALTILIKHGTFCSRNHNLEYMKKSIAIFSFLMLTSSFVHSQSDIGLLYSSENLNFVTAEWRKAINTKSNFILGATYGADGTSNFFQGSAYRIEKDTLFNVHNDFNTINATIKAGYERRIKSSPFYYGVNAFVGYKRRNSEYYESKSYFQDVFDPYQNDSVSYLFTDHNESGDRDGSMQEHFLSMRISAAFGMNLPIGKRFIFNGYISMGIQNDQLLSKDIITDTQNLYTTNPYAQTLFVAQAGVGVRYKLGKTD